MTIWPIVIASIFIFLGILGIFIPFIPDLILVFIGILIYAILTHFQEIGAIILIVFGALVLIGFLIDYLGTALGAKKFGASKYGVIGALLGAILGMVILGPFGLIIGSLLGTVLLELSFGRDSQKALKAGIGAFIGFLIATFLKLIIAITMVGIFLWKVL